MTAWYLPWWCSARPVLQASSAPACFGGYLPSVWSSASEIDAQLNWGWVIDLASLEHSTFWPEKCLGWFGCIYILDHCFAEWWRVKSVLGHFYAWIWTDKIFLYTLAFTLLVPSAGTSSMNTSGSHACPSHNTTSTMNRWGGILQCWIVSCSFFHHSGAGWSVHGTLFQNSTGFYCTFLQTVTWPLYSWVLLVVCILWWTILMVIFDTSTPTSWRVFLICWTVTTPIPMKLGRCVKHK